RARTRVTYTRELQELADRDSGTVAVVVMPEGTWKAVPGPAADHDEDRLRRVFDVGLEVVGHGAESRPDLVMMTSPVVVGSELVRDVLPALAPRRRPLRPDKIALMTRAYGPAPLPTATKAPPSSPSRATTGNLVSPLYQPNDTGGKPENEETLKRAAERQPGPYDRDGECERSNQVSLPGTNQFPTPPLPRRRPAA